MTRWMIRGASGSLKEITEQGRVSPLVARLLLNRGIDTKDKALMYLNGSLRDMRNPVLMEDMEKGVTIIADAITGKKRIVIYGDYDADGVTSTAIFCKTLGRLGADYTFHIPHREDEGYGMNLDRIQTLHEEGAQVILTCDNGISAFEEIRLAKELGMKVVVTDHHEIPIDESGKLALPGADAIVNPHRRDDTYPFKSFSGAGIAYKFSEVLFRRLDVPFDVMDDLLELAAMGTVCDVVDLLDENRILAREGLRRINATKNIGLKALIRANDLEGKKIGAYHIGFILGPCINATGRLETAKLSLDLLTTADVEEASRLAGTLVDLNQRRQEMTTEALEEVIRDIEKNGYADSKVIVVYNQSIHESIAGIVAGRIKERYYRPTIILTRGKENPKGSGRSIEEFDMIEEIKKCDDILLKYGGHPMACGLSIAEDRIDEFRARLNAQCLLSEEELTPKVLIDVPLKFDTIAEKDISDLNLLEPFGKGNASPVFGDKGLQVTNSYFIGKEKNHVKFKFKRNGVVVDGIFFNGRDHYLDEVNKSSGGKTSYTMEDTIKGILLDVVYYPDINEYNGNRNIQLNIKDVRMRKE